MSKFPLIVVGASIASFMGAGGYTLIPRSIYDGKCDIKGNISQATGERIYHVRGQEYYDDTRIHYQRGERWFCSEADARKAGCVGQDGRFRYQPPITIEHQPDQQNFPSAL